MKEKKGDGLTLLPSDDEDGEIHMMVQKRTEHKKGKKPELLSGESVGCITVDGGQVDSDSEDGGND